MSATATGIGSPPRAARRRRGFAARQLLEVHAQGALEAPSRWDWDILGELPSWCLLGEVERRRLQCACGLVFLGPELRFVVDGISLRTAGALIGPAALERVLDDAFETFGDEAGVGERSDRTAPEETPEDERSEGEDRGTEGVGAGVALDPEASGRETGVALETTGGGGKSRPEGGALGEGAEAIEPRLLGIGSTVLQATLGERLEAVLPLEALRTALGPARLGSLDTVTAERVLARAERLLAAGPGEGEAA